MFSAIDARRRQIWADRALALSWILNAIPNMTSTPRRPIHPDRINPYIGRNPGAIPLKRSNPEARAALQRWAERADERG